MNEYLAFVKLIGMSLDGRHIYQFMFTSDPDAVWGENFNVLPCGIIPDITPDPNSLSSKGKLYIKEKLITACESTCFSMQDSIDGIISLLFSECDSKYNINLRFGEDINDIRSKLKSNGLELSEMEDITFDDEAEIDDLVEKLKKGENKTSEDEDLDDF